MHCMVSRTARLFLATLCAVAFLATPLALIPPGWRIGGVTFHVMLPGVFLLTLAAVLTLGVLRPDGVRPLHRRHRAPAGGRPAAHAEDGEVVPRHRRGGAAAHWSTLGFVR